MKIQHILILFVLISCAQNTKEKNKEPVVKAKDTVNAAMDSPKKESSLSFDKVIATIKTKSLPIIDSTNFDNFKGKNFFNKQEVNMLKLENMYPSFYKETHNYKATASYKIELSRDFYTIILTILKGENEMESVLINYDLKGGIIDSKVISYDEIAEGWSRIESKIEQSKLTISNITWYDEKQETVEIFEIQGNGKIRPVDKREYSETINLSIQELMLLTKLKAIKKYGIPSSTEQFTLDDAQEEFRNGISNKYTQKERQNKSILIDEVTWEKDKNTWITVWYEVKQEKTVPKDVYVWKKGTEF